MVTPGAQPPVNSMRVLHIDDDPDYLAITKMYLESFDPEMEVVSSLSPIESLPLIESMQFDCVICDYLMPEMDGIELARATKTAESAMPPITTFSRQPQARWPQYSGT